MSINKEFFQQVVSELSASSANLVAVSKTKPNENIQSLYELGQRDFGENYVQELVDKHQQLPEDIRWHFIGHLQSNKVKYIAPFVHLIHGVDSMKLLLEIDKQGRKLNRCIRVLLQMYIAKEETKFGMDLEEAKQCLQMSADGKLPGVNIVGLMGMASFSEDTALVRSEFRSLSNDFAGLKVLPGGSSLALLSMGMSGDYKIALEEGSNMVRIGSLLFGARNYSK